MSKFWVRLIAILEIVGGIFGIGFVVLQVVAGQAGLLFPSIALAVYILSFVAGVSLLRNRPFGRIGSIIVQCIQLPKYASQLFVFMFSFGFDAYLYFALTNTSNAITGFEFKFLAFNQLFVNVAEAPVIFGVSIPASVFLAMLLKHKLRGDSADDAHARTEEIVEPGRNQVVSHSQDVNALINKATLMAVHLTLAGTLASPASFNPKCDSATLAQMLNRSSAVFSGWVVEVKGSEETQTVRLAVNKSWKGVRTTEVTLINLVHHEGPFFGGGRGYLVFAWYRGGKLTTGACSGTAELDSAEQTVRALDRWKARHRSKRQ